MQVSDTTRALLQDLALARSAVDRSAERRGDAQWLAQQWDDARTRVMLVTNGTAACDDAHGLAFVGPADVPAEAERIFLGEDGVAFFAARLELDAQPPGGSSWRSLREVGSELSDRDAGLMVAAVALDNWHRAHPHCSQCGARTRPDQGGWIRICPEHGSEHYPRTDPAVIMLVIDADDRALLGRQGRWQPGWFSTLAGFVEPGESAEAAVRREVLEESGVVVDELVYLGSQPWPFPCSLMLGYHAFAVTTEVVVDGEEIVEARWFTRAELAAACEAREVMLPPAVSIARKLVERWYGEPLPGDWIRP